MNNVLDVIQLYLHFFEREITALVLTLPRIYAFLNTSQMMGFQAIPRLVRNVIVLTLAIFAVPINLVHLDAFDGTLGSYIVHFFKEYALGVALGYSVGWIFWAVQSAGALIDNQRGAAIASSIDPLHGEETTPLGLLFSQAFLTYTFLTGAILHVIMLLYQSFVIWPVSRMIPIPNEAFPALMLSIADNGMHIVVIIAGPIVAIMFLAEFALAMISRFAPQVQVFILAMPIKSALAILILIFYFSRFMPYALEQLGGTEAEMRQLFDAITP